MPSEKHDKRVSFLINKNVWNRFLQALEYEGIDIKAEGLRAAVRDWIWKIMDRQDREALINKINELQSENTIYKNMYLREQQTNGIIKKELSKKIKQEIKGDSKNNMEDNLF